MKIHITWDHSIVSLETVEARLAELREKIHFPEGLHREGICGLFFEGPNVSSLIHSRDIVYKMLRSKKIMRAEQMESYFVADEKDPSSSVRELNDLLTMYDRMRDGIRKAITDLRATRALHGAKEIGDVRRFLEKLDDLEGVIGY